MSTVRVLLHIVLFARMAGWALVYTAVIWTPALILAAATGSFVTGVACTVAGAVYLAGMASWIADYRREVTEIRRVNWREIDAFRTTVKEAGR